MSRSPELRILLAGIGEGYDKKAWHGPNLRGSVRGLTAREAAWRPARNRHNIWEIVVHCAYWKYVVRRRITQEPRGSFPLEGSNWFRRPGGGGADEAAWRADLRLLREMHLALTEAAARLSAADLRKVPKGSTVDIRATVSGIAAHDVYHAGQIQLIKRLMP